LALVDENTSLYNGNSPCMHNAAQGEEGFQWKQRRELHSQGSLGNALPAYQECGASSYILVFRTESQFPPKNCRVHFERIARCEQETGDKKREHPEDH
jgi:hypothetical protein